MIDFESTQLNEIFIQALSDPEMKTAAENKGAEYLKVQIYEDSFMERILPAQSISPAQCDRDVNSPNYQVVIDQEFTDAIAITTGLRGRADFEYVEGDRYAVKFHKIESPEHSLTEGELRGYRMPIQNLIRHKIAYEIRKKMDEQFIGMSNAAVSATGFDLDLSGTGEKILTPTVLADARRQIDNQNANGRYLRASTILMTQSLYNYIGTWAQANTASGAGTAPGMAGGMTQEFWRDGYNYDKLYGLRVIRTAKSDLLFENEVMLYTEPEYLGHHFTFDDDRFAIVHHFDEIKWKGFRTFGAAIGNQNAVAKLTLDSLPL